MRCKFEVGDGVLVAAVHDCLRRQLGELANQGLVHVVCVAGETSAAKGLFHMESTPSATGLMIT